MMPAVIIFLAVATLSSLPAAVIHIKPPIKIKTTAMMPKNPKIMLITFAAISRGSFTPKPVKLPIVSVDTLPQPTLFPGVPPPVVPPPPVLVEPMGRHTVALTPRS